MDDFSACGTDNQSEFINVADVYSFKEKLNKLFFLKQHSCDFRTEILLFLPSIHGGYHPAKDFFRSILHAEYRAATDVYALMFLTDVIDFIVIIFGFWAFGVRDDFRLHKLRKTEIYASNILDQIRTK